jgi:antitoxin ParD1/3/4
MGEFLVLASVVAGKILSAFASACQQMSPTAPTQTAKIAVLVILLISDAEILFVMESDMDVSLPPELERLVRHKVETGGYGSASDVIGEALRLMDERDRLAELHRDEIRKKIAAGMASLRAGKGVDGEAAFDRIDAELDAAERGGQV